MEEIKFKVGDKVLFYDIEETIASLPGMKEYDIKGFSDAEEGCLLESGHWAYQSSLTRHKPGKEFKEVYKNIKELGNLETLTNEPKRSLTNKLMKSITTFAKDLTLSSDEKALREAGLKNSEGAYTSNALEVAKDLEAKSRGYKNFEDMGSSLYGFDNAFSLFEIEAMLTKYSKDLLDIAIKFNKENDKKCK